jgi:hypothetical protein
VGVDPTDRPVCVCVWLRGVTGCEGGGVRDGGGGGRQAGRGPGGGGGRRRARQLPGQPAGRGAVGHGRGHVVRRVQFRRSVRPSDLGLGSGSVEILFFFFLFFLIRSVDDFREEEEE